MADYHNAFASLDVRQKRQVRTRDVKTGIRTAARACMATNDYYLIRWQGDDLSTLSDAERHFLDENETPAERTKRIAHDY